MGRLIDADKFKGKVIASHTGSGVIKLIAIDDVPTAYDPDKVEDQLGDVRMRYFLTYANTGNKTNDEVWEKASRAMDDAIEIVKSGGNADLLMDRAKSKSGNCIPYDGKWK